MIITRTPFRLSFFGGGTDYPAWYVPNGGLVIGSTFARYCYISCRALPPFFAHKTRVVYSLIENVKDHGEIQHPAVRACLKYMNFENGLEIHHDGDLPAHSGLGSSSSFTVGLLLALHGLRHQMVTKQTLAAEAIKVEQGILEEHVGIQDQILAAHGGLNVIEMGPGQEYRVSPLVLPADYRRALQDHVLLGFTGITRFSSNVAKEQIQTISSGQSRMGEMKSLSQEALTLFRNQGDFRRIGELIDNCWALKRGNGKGVSNPQVDELYAAARRAGAYGGKLLGAGGGGFVMFFAPPEMHARIRESLPQLKVWVPFKFEHDGAQVIFHTDTHQEQIESVAAR